LTDTAQLPAELVEKLSDPEFRLYSGAIYRIIVKGDDDDDDGLVLPFKPNRAQRRFMQRLWHRNVILKARQLGFSTLVCILWLDTAMFSKDPIRCGIIAQDKEAAESLFRGKILYAYDNLPEVMRQMFPLSKRTATEIEFAHNGSSIRVATSMRSGTIHRLHVSEFGKICAKYPDKAKEVITGSIPSVPKSGILVIESTAEGQDGDFYKITQRAEAIHLQGSELSPKDYKFHFFPWWEAPEYVLDPDLVVMTDTDNKYFGEIEALIKRKLTPEQRAWWVSTRDNDFNGEAPLMWQEYPSTSREAFQVSTEGCYYAGQLSKAREQGRIVRNLPILPIPVNTFWDLGRGDMTTIWLHQRHTMQDRFHRYYENSGEDLSHYVAYLLALQQELRITFGTHYLPHDAEYKRLGISPDTNKSMSLDRYVQFWPTPRSSPNENRQTRPTPSQLAGKHGMNLATAVNMWPTPTAHEARLGYQRRDTGKKGTQESLTTVVINSMGGREEVGGQLNPTWVEWLMGFPLGHTDLEPSETP
jgi:hypothetical protein